MRIDVHRCDSCMGWHLDCNEVRIATSQSEGVCNRMARILSEAENRPSREAMKLMKDEIGFDEEHALEILSVMHGGKSRPTLQ